MTVPVAHPDVSSATQTGRIDAVDVLRGVALLGILVMNVQSFAMPEAAYFNPTAYGDLEGANLYAWVAGRMLADQKFMTIFSMLFGASIVLMVDRAKGRGDARRVHYRRMAWLIVIGLLHAHLLWSGDILFLYGVCGMLVYPLRRQPSGRLLVLGVALLAIASAYSVGSGLSLPYWSEEALSSFTGSSGGRRRRRSTQSWPPIAAAGSSNNPSGRRARWNSRRTPLLLGVFGARVG